jgi:hypothetical protein
MTPDLSPWRATYAPGDWLVLAGPTSLVVVQSVAPEWSELVASLWEEVLASRSMVELAEQLVTFGIAETPSFGAFFWTDDGMRSLVRGEVVVLDAATGERVADGQGVQTWTEVGLAGVDRIRIETPEADAGVESLELPLVLGAVRASALTLDATPGAGVSAVQGVRSGTAAAEAEVVVREADEARDDGVADVSADQPDTLSDPTELMESEATLTPEDDEWATQPQQAAPLARLMLSDGTELDLDQVVRIGRAPNADPVGDLHPRLVTVSSPNSDISRTHLQIAARDGAVMVVDLHSTNGTILVRPVPGTPPERLPAGAEVPVPMGSVLELGDGVTVRIEPPP